MLLPAPPIQVQFSIGRIDPVRCPTQHRVSQRAIGYRPDEQVHHLLAGLRAVARDADIVLNVAQQAVQVITRIKPAARH